MRFVDTTRDQKAIELFVRHMPVRNTEAIFADVAHLAAGSQTRVWTDCWGGNIGEEYFKLFDVVNHKREWVAENGTHTNTVESGNRRLKDELASRSGQLGKTEEARRIQFLACIVNDRLAAKGQPHGAVISVMQGWHSPNRDDMTPQSNLILHRLSLRGVAAIGIFGIIGIIQNS
eukprot:PhM_4_TR78/c0_g1_i1/m.42137